MRLNTFGISLAFGLCLACDGGEKQPPGKPAATPEKTAELKADSNDHGKSAAEPVVKVIRPEDEPTSPEEMPAEKLEDLEVAEAGLAYGQVLVQTRSEETHLAELTIVRAEGVKARAGAVRYTAEPRVIVAKAKPTLDESNVFGTGISVDVDGDGKTTSKISSKCEGGTEVWGTKPPIRLEAVTELSDAVARFDYGANDARSLLSDGAGVVLYAPCEAGTLIFGLNPSAPLSMHEVPSPAAFVVYRVEAESMDAQDPFTLQKVSVGEEAIDHQLHPFREISVEGDIVKVYAAHLVVFALDPAVALQHVSLEIAGEKPEFITASVNEVDGDGKRIRYGDGFKPF